MEQLTLNLNLPDYATFTNFCIGDNLELISYLKQAVTVNPTLESFIYIWGTCGMGKSHLLKACCEEVNNHHNKNHCGRIFYLPLAKIDMFSKDILKNLESFDIVCIDDLHMIQGSVCWQESFFHFYNRLIDDRRCLITTANLPPKELRLKIADLKSRLSSGLTFQLKPLSDQDKVKALILHAKERELILKEHVANFIVNHYQRDMISLMNSLNYLDQASLQKQHPLTIPFVKHVLAI